MQQFDYVVVGGGTAGCILANRLTESGKRSVLVLEAGGEGRSVWVPIPAGFTKLLTSRTLNWNFSTEPEPNVAGRQIAIPRGKGLGGCTLINGMIYVRGQPGDYDEWARVAGAGWSYESVAPYFERIENYQAGGDGRGRNGPMHIMPVRERFPISDAFLAAASSDGQPLVDDYNGASQEGFGYYQVTQRNGSRWSVVDGYLKPARGRRNLVVRTNCQVTRLHIDGTRCTGVSYVQNGREVRVSAHREVVLSAGAIQSPHLLELSGVGDPRLLQSVGIPVRHALAGVGENYIDHFATRMNWRVRSAETINEMARGWRLACALGDYWLRRRGILTLGTGLVHGFVKTRPDLATPDIQYFYVHASYANAATRKLDRAPGMTVGVSQLRPQSRGSIHVCSKEAFVPPRIRPNLLSSPTDQESLVAGMQIARRIVSRAPMQPFIDFEMSPGADVQTDDEWLEFARRNGQTIYHPIGTCRMGRDSAAVVDPELRVRGLSGLRVVDASVIPSMVSGNIQAAVMMVAERASEFIRAAE